MKDTIVTLLPKTVLVVGAVLGAFLLAGSLFSDYVGYQVRIVESGSMEPTIPVGAVIVLRTHDTYRIDDIITFRRQGGTKVTTHRIVGKEMIDGKEQYVTRGDANNVSDRSPVPPEEVLGAVWWHVPYLGFLVNAIRHPIGFLILIGVPATLIVFEEGRKIRREVRKRRSEDITD